MTNRTLKAIAAVAVITPASLGRCWQSKRAQADQRRSGDGWGAGLIGFGIGAIVGSALAPREVYVVPDYDYEPAYYGPAAYGPPPWTGEWYSYCAQRYRSFNARTGYFTGYDGLPYFCQ
ncbi:MAG TPA: BA14K family protein [Methyloceanibacter sp.]|nr:BA14K family protein [Methyloceanibacter sp.]